MGVPPRGDRSCVPNRWPPRPSAKTGQNRFTAPEIPKQQPGWSAFLDWFRVLLSYGIMLRKKSCLRFCTRRKQLMMKMVGTLQSTSTFQTGKVVHRCDPSVVIVSSSAAAWDRPAPAPRRPRSPRWHCRWGTGSTLGGATILSVPPPPIHLFSTIYLTPSTTRFHYSPKFYTHRHEGLAPSRERNLTLKAWSLKPNLNKTHPRFRIHHFFIILILQNSPLSSTPLTTSHLLNFHTQLHGSIPPSPDNDPAKTMKPQTQPLRDKPPPKKNQIQIPPSPVPPPLGPRCSPGRCSRPS